MPRSKSSDRHTDAGFSSEEMQSFLEGVTVHVRSSNMVKAQWDAAGNRLICTYGDGARYAYAADREMAKAFARAPSKMGWIWDHYLHLGDRGTKL